MYSLAGRYDNPIPTRFLAPIDCLKIPALIDHGIFTVDYPVYDDYLIVHLSPLVSINRVCVIIFVQ
jgi:hypothetical protein